MKWELSGVFVGRPDADSCCRGIRGAIIMYDVSCSSTIDDVEFWNNTIRKHMDGYAPIVLVGNKIDDVRCRQVSYEKGKV